MRLPSRWDTDPEAIVEKQVLPNGGPVFLLSAEPRAEDGGYAGERLGTCREGYAQEIVRGEGHARGRLCAEETMRGGDYARGRLCAGETMRGGDYARGDYARRRLCAEETMRGGDYARRRLCAEGKPCTGKPCAGKPQNGLNTVKPTPPPAQRAVRRAVRAGRSRG